jgi:hypothetical protein
MAQITPATIEMIRAHHAKREHAPLTIWEVHQLAYAWEQNDKLRLGLREIYETYAGSEGLPASTASEAYLTRLITQMANIAGVVLAETEGNSDDA